MHLRTFDRLANEYGVATSAVTEAMRPTLERWRADRNGS
jgi:hypothetical protein